MISLIIHIASVSTSVIIGYEVMNEQEIVSEALGGNNSARRMLYDLHIRYMTGVCSRYISDPEDIKDVLQNSYMKVFSSLASFEYRGDGSLKAWIARIVVNESLSHLRRYGRLRFEPIDDDVANLAGEEPPAAELPPDLIHALIRKLPDGYRTIFNLYVFEEKSHKEIAGLLGISENTSASQFHRARKLLMKNIRQYQAHTHQAYTV